MDKQLEGSPPECVILIGLPAAGKTTLFRQQFSSTHLHVSKDLWPNAANRAARQKKMIEDTLAGGASIVIDNTNATVAERKCSIDLARRYGARIVGYHFDISTRVSVARNANRTGREKVPNVAIFTAAKRFQRPACSEGFDQLFRVEIVEDRSFRITEVTC